jgi:hypothetical protein
MNSETASIYGVQALRKPDSFVLAFAGMLVSHPGNPPPAAGKSKIIVSLPYIAQTLTCFRLQ